ncbi:MAG: tetratricopeptide repeat protein [Pseudomonadota bacterium]
MKSCVDFASPTIILAVLATATPVTITEAQRLMSIGDQAGAIHVLEQIRKKEPTNEAARKLLIKYFSWTNSSIKALPVYEELVALHPDDHELAMELARQYIGNGQAKKAAPIYAQMAAKAPQDVAIREKLIQVYMWTGQAPQAIPVLWELHRLKPNDRALAERLATLLIQLGKAEDAIPLYQSIASNHPDDRTPLDQLVKIYGWTSNTTERTRTLEQLRKVAPDDMEIVSELAQQYEWTGRGNEAIPLLQLLLKVHPNDAKVHARLGQQRAAAGERRNALEHLRRSTQLDPDNTDARFLLAQLCHWSTCWQESKVHYREILRRNPNHGPALRASVLLRQSRGSRWPARAQFFRDSNQVNRLTLGTGFDIVLNQKFSLVGSYEHTLFVEEDRVPFADLNMDAVEVGAKARIGSSVVAFADLGAQHAWDNATSPTLRAGVKLSLLGQIFINGTYRYHLHPNRIQSVVDRIQAHRLSASVYSEPKTWFAASAAVVYDILTDNNEIVTIFSGLWFTPIRDPLEIKLGVTLGYENAHEIRVDALPYYTPDSVLVITPGIDLVWRPVGPLEIGAGYGLSLSAANEPAHSPRVSLSWNVTPFDRLVGRYSRTGATVYTADLATITFEHIFQ